MGRVNFNLKEKIGSIDKKITPRQKNKRLNLERKIEIKEKLDEIEEKRRLSEELESYFFDEK